MRLLLVRVWSVDRIHGAVAQCERETIRLQAGGERSSREREDPRVPRSRSSDPNSHHPRRALSQSITGDATAGEIAVSRLRVPVLRVDE